MIPVDQVRGDSHPETARSVGLLYINKYECNNTGACLYLRPRYITTKIGEKGALIDTSPRINMSAPTIVTAGVPNKAVSLYKTVSRYKAVKIAWRGYQ